MKIIDLLNKIANGEEAPKTIKYRGLIFDYDDIDYYNTDLGYLFEKYAVLEILNDEVEIIEEDKKIENLYYRGEDNTDKLIMIRDKINEIIDYIQEK